MTDSDRTEGSGALQTLDRRLVAAAILVPIVLAFFHRGYFWPTADYVFSQIIRLQYVDRFQWFARLVLLTLMLITLMLWWRPNPFNFGHGEAMLLLAMLGWIGLVHGGLPQLWWYSYGGAYGWWMGFHRTVIWMAIHLWVSGMLWAILRRVFGVRLVKLGEEFSPAARLSIRDLMLWTAVIAFTLCALPVGFNYLFADAYAQGIYTGLLADGLYELVVPLGIQIALLLCTRFSWKIRMAICSVSLLLLVMIWFAIRYAIGSVSSFASGVVLPYVFTGLITTSVAIWAIESLGYRIVSGKTRIDGNGQLSIDSA